MAGVAASAANSLGSCAQNSVTSPPCALLQFAQALLVPEPDLAIDLHQLLVGAQHRRAMVAARVHFAVVEIGVAGMQLPAVRAVYRDPGMADRVPGERHHQDFRRQSGQIAHAFEPEPALARGAIAAPFDGIVPLSRPVAVAIERRQAQGRGAQFGIHHMHGRVREILDAAGMVEIEMGQDDVAHIVGPQPETLDLPARGLPGIKLHPVGVAEKRAEPPRPGTSPRPNPVSTSTRLSAASISRQWQTIVAGPRPGVTPSHKYPP